MTAPAHEPWEAAAFGLRLTAALPDPPPLAPAAAASDERRCTIEERTPDDARGRWPRRSARRVAALRGHDGSLALTVAEAPGAGYRFGLPGAGTWTVTHDGSAVACAVRPMQPWKARRLLFAHVLPLAAALRGVEVLHASAVARDGAALAVVADRGGGKSTLVAELLRRDGWSFVADDTVAAEARQDGVVVHPGPGALALREDARRRLGRAGEASLGNVVGRDERSYYAPVPVPRPVPLRRLVVLQRDGRTGGGVEVGPLSGPAFGVLAPHAKVPFVLPPQRLVAQLDLIGRLASDVALRAVRFGAEATPAAVVDAIVQDAS